MKPGNTWNRFKQSFYVDLLRVWIFFTLKPDFLNLLHFSCFHFFLSVLSPIFIDSARMWLGVTTRPPQVPFLSPNLIFHFMHTSHIFCHIHCGGLSLRQRDTNAAVAATETKKKKKKWSERGPKTVSAPRPNKHSKNRWPDFRQWVRVSPAMGTWLELRLPKPLQIPPSSQPPPPTSVRILQNRFEHHRETAA